MSEEDDDSSDKEHEASPQKLIEARKKGDIPRSPDLLAAASIAGFLLALVTLGAWAVARAGTAVVISPPISDPASTSALTLGSRSTARTASARGCSPTRGIVSTEMCSPRMLCRSASEIAPIATWPT